MFKNAVKALIPKVELPDYFKISSVSLPGGATQISAKFLDKNYVKQVPAAKPTIIDVLRAFDGLDLSRFPKPALAALEYVMLPAQWDLECSPAQLQQEGFHITLDVHHATRGTKRWEKNVHVSAIQLAEFVDVLEWVKQANKMERPR